jgi:protein TonB
MMSGTWLNDRFTISMVLAVSLHAVTLLGIGFVMELNPLDDAADTLDVVLVNFSSETAPEEADFLAQANQQGGGESDEVLRPAQELTSVLPSAGEGLMPASAEPVAAPETPDLRETLSAPGATESLPDATRIEQPEPDLPSMAELMQQRMQVAELQARLQRDKAFESRLKRRRFISANTREYEFASYMQAWVSKVERVGNLNYPPEVRRRKLVGNLLLTVGINHDGSVESIDIRRSSGTPELDEAALRIVRLAAPYAPLPQNIRSQVDVLHITRTWKFSTGQTFQ